MVSQDITNPPVSERPIDSPYQEFHKEETPSGLPHWAKEAAVIWLGLICLVAVAWLVAPGPLARVCCWLWGEGQIARGVGASAASTVPAAVAISFGLHMSERRANRRVMLAAVQQGAHQAEHLADRLAYERQMLELYKKRRAVDTAAALAERAGQGYNIISNGASMTGGPVVDALPVQLLGLLMSNTDDAVAQEVLKYIMQMSGLPARSRPAPVSQDIVGLEKSDGERPARYYGSQMALDVAEIQLEEARAKAELRARAKKGKPRQPGEYRAKAVMARKPVTPPLMDGERMRELSHLVVDRMSGSLCWTLMQEHGISRPEHDLLVAELDRAGLVEKPAKANEPYRLRDGTTLEQVRAALVGLTGE